MILALIVINIVLVVGIGSLGGYARNIHERLANSNAGAAKLKARLLDANADNRRLQGKLTDVLDKQPRVFILAPTFDRAEYIANQHHVNTRSPRVGIITTGEALRGEIINAGDIVLFANDWNQARDLGEEWVNTLRRSGFPAFLSGSEK